jgi:hypothetical protein
MTNPNKFWVLKHRITGDFLAESFRPIPLLFLTQEGARDHKRKYYPMEPLRAAKAHVAPGWGPEGTDE